MRQFYSYEINKYFCERKKTNNFKKIYNVYLTWKEFYIYRNYELSNLYREAI